MSKMDKKDKVKVIWKYKIPTVVIGVFSLCLSKGAEILFFGLSHKYPCIWVLENKEVELEEREFSLYGTGWEIPEKPGKYIGTVCMFKDNLVWHLFEKEG